MVLSVSLKHNAKGRTQCIFLRFTRKTWRIGKIKLQAVQEHQSGAKRGNTVIGIITVILIAAADGK